MKNDLKLIAETMFFRHYITNIYPSGVCSYVSDTYNFWDVITKIAPACKEEILARTPNALGLAKTVFRPDSGDPFRIICGYDIHELVEYTDVDDIKERDISDDCEVVKVGGKYYEVDKYARYYYGDFDGYDLDFKEITESEALGAVRCLWNTFGGTETSTGYRMLSERVGLIYGDSITLERAEEILTRLAKMNFASGNVVFGIGSYTYQYITRDTYGMAMKATHAVVNGTGRELFKDPATDKGVKKSAKGLLHVGRDENGVLFLKDQATREEEATGELELVYEDGTLIRYQTVEEIRNIVRSEAC